MSRKISNKEFPYIPLELWGKVVEISGSKKVLLQLFKTVKYFYEYICSSPFHCKNVRFVFKGKFPNQPLNFVYSLYIFQFHNCEKPSLPPQHQTRKLYQSFPSLEKYHFYEDIASLKRGPTSRTNPLFDKCSEFSKLRVIYYVLTRRSEEEEEHIFREGGQEVCNLSKEILISSLPNLETVSISMYKPMYERANILYKNFVVRFHPE